MLQTGCGIVAESLNRYNVESIELQGFVKYKIKFISFLIY